MIRPIDARLFRLAAGLMVFSILVSGCFQTAGAALESTATPQGGAVVAAGPTMTATELPPPPTAITPQITLTPTIQQLQFMTDTPTGAPPTGTQIPTNVVQPLNTIASNTNTPVPTTQTALVFAASATATLLPTETAFPTATLTPSNTPTEPILITPTKQAGVSVAQAGTPIFGNQAATQTLQALNAQATGILQTVTAAAGIQQTLIATLAGTGLPNGAVPATTVPGVVNPLPTIGPAVGNGTPQGTPGSAGSGAAGFITGDCQYTVVSGDRLYRIALRFNVTSYRIATANNLLNPELIVPGQVLRIPGCNGTTTPSAAANTGGAVIPSTGSAGRTYVVQEGDTLFAIAMRNGVRVMAIAQANGITNINLIYIGQTITIP